MGTISNGRLNISSYAWLNNSHTPAEGSNSTSKPRVAASGFAWARIRCNSSPRPINSCRPTRPRTRRKFSLELGSFIWCRGFDYFVVVKLNAILPQTLCFIQCAVRSGDHGFGTINDRGKGRYADAQRKGATRLHLSVRVMGRRYSLPDSICDYACFRDRGLREQNAKLFAPVARSHVGRA